MRNTKWLGAGMLVFLLGGPALGWSEEVHVAVASNFLNPLKEIAASYKQETRWS